MASCFQPNGQSLDEDSVVLFSTSSDSPGPGGATSGSSSASSSHHSSPANPSSANLAYELSIRKLSYAINRQGAFFFSSLRRMKPQIEILRSVSFTARCSELLAIVGPSGTGKSSLLRVTSGRVKDNHFQPNSVFLNGHAVASPAQLRKICGFVAQDDDLLPLLTVKETLMFSAKFRLNELTAREQEERVNGLLNELGLVHVADGFVGDEENRGISGGERKRVSIGVEMIHDPPILFLDEPTSGLDSSSALQVIELLSSMAKSKQRTVMLSIHQPSYRMFEHISNFLILSCGSVVHNGSIISLEVTISKLGFQIPVQINALEFSMEIMDALKESYSKNQDHLYFVDHKLPIRQAQLPINDNGEKGGCFFRHLYEIMVLCTRFLKIIYRTKQLFFARTMQALVGGFGLGTVYLKVRNDEGGIAERLGLFAFSLSFLLSSTVEALPIYLQERRVLMKEASKGAYKVSSYMIANTIIFLPFLFAVAVLFSVPVYWLVGFNPSFSAFGIFLLVVWLIVLMASSIVLFLSAISPDFISGNSLICTVLGAFFLFSGYFIPKECIPKYWLFMYYVSLYRYPLDSLLTNEYWSQRSECFSWSTKEYTRCVLTGNDVLKTRGLDRDTRGINFGIMFCFFVLYRVLCWMILARRVSKTII